MKIQFGRYLSAVELPDGKIVRHSLSASSGGTPIHRWGVVPRLHEEACGWGEASYMGVNDPHASAELSAEVVAELSAITEKTPPAAGSAAYWLLCHLPYWGEVNDGNRVVAVHGPRPAVAEEMAAIYAAVHH